jgi:hypothetical protein
LNSIKECWTASKAYRVLLIAAIVYAVLRLAIQAYLFDSALQPEAIAQGEQVSADLQLSYIPAAQHFKAHQDIYLQGSLAILEYQFPYSPAFAFFFMPILLLPINVLVPLLVILHIAAYILFYIWWDRILERTNLHSVAIMWAKMLPLFLVFTVFWDDLAYMNIYLIVALFATFAVDAVLHEELIWASFWLGAVILPIKPHWAFVLALPLLLGRYKFFLKLLLGTILAYLAVAGITILAGGVGYGLQQYHDYFAFLARLSRDFPWRGPDQPFLGYNHSIMQIVLYYLGVSAVNMRIAMIIKLLLLVPLGLIALKFLRHPINRPGFEVPEMALALTFALYLGAFIWLDMVWELSLALIIFAYFLATIEQKRTKTFLWILFIPYAILDIWRLVSYIALGDSVLYEGSYVLTDPLIYIPWIMILLLIFYSLLLQRLNRYSLAPAK